ncbi:MAG TPA: MFS transporter [Candidatus Dormibacteraeota bacterium]
MSAAPTARARVTLGLASLAVLLAAADTYVVVLALTAIMADVGVDIDQLQKATPIISGFLLGYVVVLPLLGRLSDLYGRRPVFVACLAVFATGSMITACAQDLTVVVVGRTLQGLGGGGLVPVTLAIVADLWPPGRRGVPLGAVGAVQELGSVLGPLYGAGIVALSGWRTIFWLNLPVAALLGVGFHLSARGGLGETGPSRRGWPDLVGVALLLVAAAALALALAQPTTLTDSETWGQLYLPVVGSSQLTTPLALLAAGALVAAMLWWLTAPLGVRPLLRLQRLPELVAAVDWLGAGLLGGVLACVILAFAAADPSAHVVAANGVITLPLGAVLAAAFVVHELRSHEPLIDFRGMSDRAAWGSLLVNLAVGAALMAALVDIPIFARSTVAPHSQVDAALELLRLLVAVPIGAVLGGLICERLGYRLTVALGMLLCAVTFVLMARWDTGALGARGALLGVPLPVGGADVALFVCGLGFGLAIAPVNAAVLGAVRASLHGVASALVVVARMVGMLVGLSLLTAIGLRRFYAAASHIPSPNTLCPKTPTNCPAYDALQTAAVIDELHAIFLGAAISAGVAMVLALALLRRPAGRTEAAEAAPHGVLARLAASG